MNKHTALILFLFFSSTLLAQNKWVLQPWMQVVGKYNGEELGLSVSYLGKCNDRTLIGVSDAGGHVYVYQIAAPADTIPKYTISGMSSTLGDFNGDGVMDAGCHTAMFDGSKLSSGVYFARAEIDFLDGSKPIEMTRKLLLAK